MRYGQNSICIEERRKGNCKINTKDSNKSFFSVQHDILKKLQEQKFRGEIRIIKFEGNACKMRLLQLY